jgi:hypothetical protein
MTTLLVRCQAVSAIVADVETARRDQHVRERLGERAREWSEQRSKLTAARGRAEWIELQPKQVAQFVQKREQLSRHAKEAVDRLATGAGVATLTEDPLWTKLLKSASGAADALDEAVRAAWRELIDKLGALDSPATLDATLPKTPANRQALEAYRAQYAEFKKLSEQLVPRSAEDKARLERVIAECRNALSNVQRDLPKEVDEFFRAVDAHRATLALVTPGVLSWLAQNGQLDRYQVRIADK